MKLKMPMIACVLFVLLFAGCPLQNGGKPTAPQEPAQSLIEEPSSPSAVTIKKSDLLALFDLTETKITASDAAKKIAAGTGKKIGMLTFSKNQAVAYDDKAGTFTVKVKGTKGAKAFDKTFNVSGFTHPYENVTMLAVNKAELNLDEAIEHNYSLDAFIAKTKESSFISPVKELNILLSDNKTEISLGTHGLYALTTELENSGGKVKIKPVFEKIYRKKPAESDSVEEIKERIADGFASFALIKDYFTEQNVVNYVLEKVKGNFFTVDSNKFASELYARSRGNNDPLTEYLKTGEGTVFKKYKDLYSHKSDEEHLQLNLSVALSDPNAGGVSADDYAGSLGLTYYILGEKSGSSAKFTAVQNGEKYPGFKRITADELRNMFTFTLIPGSGTNQKSNWIKKEFSKPLLSGDFGSYQVKDVLKKPAENSYYLTIFEEDYAGKYLVTNNKIGLSKGINDVLILITGITLKKESGTGALNVICSFEGNGEPITITRGEHIK